MRSSLRRSRRAPTPHMTVPHRAGTAHAYLDAHDLLGAGRYVIGVDHSAAATPIIVCLKECADGTFELVHAKEWP